LFKYRQIVSSLLNTWYVKYVILAQTGMLSGISLDWYFIHTLAHAPGVINKA